MSDQLPWNTLVFGSYNKQQVKLAVADVVWTRLRYAMLDRRWVKGTCERRRQ